MSFTKPFGLLSPFYLHPQDSAKKRLTAPKTPSNVIQRMDTPRPSVLQTNFFSGAKELRKLKNSRIRSKFCLDTQTLPYVPVFP